MEKQTRKEEIEKEIKEMEQGYYGFRTCDKNKYGINHCNSLKAELQGIKEGRTQAISEFKEKLKEMNNFTTYDIMHRGFTICPTLSRDAYLQEVWIKFSDLNKTAQEIK